MHYNTSLAKMEETPAITSLNEKVKTFLQMENVLRDETAGAQGKQDTIWL
jgi:hypothetical protein